MSVELPTRGEIVDGLLVERVYKHTYPSGLRVWKVRVKCCVCEDVKVVVKTHLMQGKCTCKCRGDEEMMEKHQEKMMIKKLQKEDEEREERRRKAIADLKSNRTKAKSEKIIIKWGQKYV